MLRSHWMCSSAAAVAYYSAADYFATTPGEWLGKGAVTLGLTGASNQDHFISLAHNLHPQTGEKLRPRAKEGERVGLDLTFNASKSVSIARELANGTGDDRIEDAHREAVSYVVGLIEKDMQGRVRQGYANANRTTGNLVAYRVTHRDTRINADDQMPDMNLHDHVFVFNATFDPVERQWKAAELGQIKHDLPYFEAAYHNRLAANLKTLGYGVERKGRAFEIAGIDRPLIEKFSRRSRYINAVADKLGIKRPESKAKLGATTRLGKTKETSEDLQGYYASRLTEAEKQQLAGLRGLPGSGKTVEEAVAYAIGHEFERRSVVEERQLYRTALQHGVGSVTPEGVEAEAKRQGLLVRGADATTKAVLAEEQKVIAFARDGRGTCRPMGSPDPSGIGGPLGVPRGKQPDPATSVPSLQAGMTRLFHGAAKLDAINEARWFSSDRRYAEGYAEKSGGENGVVYFVDMPTDHPLIEPEWPDQSIARGFHRNVELPRGMAEQAKPLAHRLMSASAQAVSSSTNDHVNETWSENSGNRTHHPPLSPDQARMVNHVLSSPDRVILLRGAAGTGKTHSMSAAIRRLDRPVVVLAPSADASRGVLRKEGFADADTVARFLGDERLQQQARGGLIWVDEATLMGVRDTRAMFEVAEKIGARVVLQGDPRQHRAVPREADLFRTLQAYAGLPVAELREIRRQSGRYKEAVAAIERGEVLAGHDILTALGWVHLTPADDHNRPVADAYLDALATRRPGQDMDDRVLVVAPTHAEGREVTAAIREGLRARGLIGTEGVILPTLSPVQWTEAERGDTARYDGSEVIEHHRNGGTFRAGQRTPVAAFKPTDRLGPASTFAVFTPSEIELAVGDRVRITKNGWTADRKHRLDNKARYTVAGFEPDGRIRLTNGWHVAPDFKHLTHGYVGTSVGGQGKTADRVLIALGRESLPAANLAEFYVDVSRARHQATIFTDAAPNDLRAAVQRADTRQSATSLMQPKPRPRAYDLVRRAKQAWNQLRDRAARVIQEKTRERMYSHGR